MSHREQSSFGDIHSGFVFCRRINLRRKTAFSFRRASFSKVIFCMFCISIINRACAASSCARRAAIFPPPAEKDNASFSMASWRTYQLSNCCRSFGRSGSPRVNLSCNRLPVVSGTIWILLRASCFMVYLSGLFLKHKSRRRCVATERSVETDGMIRRKNATPSGLWLNIASVYNPVTPSGLGIVINCYDSFAK